MPTRYPKAPLPPARKYMFDMHNFDSDFVPETEEELPPPPPPPPTFSEEEMAIARQTAFDAGRREAMNEAAASRAQELNVIAGRIAQALDEFSGQETGRNAVYEKEAVTLALSLFQTAFPVLKDALALTEIRGLLERVTAALPETAAVKVLLHPDDEADMRALLTAPVTEKGAPLTLAAQPDIAPGACRIEWTDGGAARNPDSIYQNMVRELEHILATDPEKNDNKEADNPSGNTP